MLKFTGKGAGLGACLRTLTLCSTELHTFLHLYIECNNREVVPQLGPERLNAMICFPIPPKYVIIPERREGTISGHLRFSHSKYDDATVMYESCDLHHFIP